MRPLLSTSRISLSEHSSRQGTVLILVLWVSLGLVTIALYFGHSMMLEYRAAQNAVAGHQALQAIEGASRYVRFLLANLDEAGNLPALDDYQAEEAPVGQGAFWFLGRGDERTQIDTPVFSLLDEASKLNLNTATQEMLEALPGMTPELAAAIIDWRDVDEDVTPGGAESQTYLLRDSPYHAKNSGFETTLELRLVEGMNWKILFGEDANLNGILDPNENDGERTFPDDNQDGILDSGLLEYVTAFSREPNTKPDGSPKVHLNNQDGQLEQLLEETFGSERAQQIWRNAGGRSRSRSFSSVLDFFLRSGMTPEEFSQIEYQLTNSEGDSIEGRVNVNTASEVVLSCIPGIGNAYASQLVDSRQGRTEELNSITWILQVLDPESALEASPYLTTRSYQVSADITAIGANGRGLRRVLFVFDTRSGEPVVIYRRDLSGLGWPLGSETYKELISMTGESRRFQ